MIDLKNKTLPDTVKVNGRVFKIYTDFRVWLKFNSILQNKKDITLNDLNFVFVNQVPKDDYFESLQDFFNSPSSTPIRDDTLTDTKTRIIDLDEDGEYIWSSVLQQFGIDLCDTEYLHWHKFLALLNSLGSDTKIGSIMQIRSYTKKKDDFDTQAERLKSIWALPEKLSQTKIKELERKQEVVKKLLGGD